MTFGVRPFCRAAEETAERAGRKLMRDAASAAGHPTHTFLGQL